MKDIAQIIECGLELSIKGAFHLDLNFDNIIKDDRVYFIDPSIAKNHFRPKHNYFNERAISYHWAPELINGGQITEKSSIYSVGKTIKFCCRDVDLKVSKLIDLFLEEKPINRPSFSESYSIIKEII